jgi:hypothetical protein
MPQSFLSVPAVAGIVLLSLVAGVLFVAIGARFSDGPVGPFPGGPLEFGETVGGEPDWRIAEQREEVQLQLLTPPRSRTTWILYHAGAAYIPCGMPNFTLWKQWPHQALEDPRAVVRIRMQKFPVTLSRVEDPETFDALKAVLEEKYGDYDLGPERLWFFRLDSRGASEATADAPV